MGAVTRPLKEAGGRRTRWPTGAVAAGSAQLCSISEYQVPQQRGVLSRDRSSVGASVEPIETAGNL